MVWATREKDVNFYKHDFYGTFAIMIDTYGSVVDLNETPFFVYHGWLMWTSWGILGLI